MAMAERALAGEFGSELIDHRTYVFLGDGCLQEGIGQKAISLASHLGLGKPVVLFDDNEISIDGPTSIAFSDDVPARLTACSWRVQSCGGHGSAALSVAISAAKTAGDKPPLIAMKTMIGFGAPTKAGTSRRLPTRDTWCRAAHRDRGCGQVRLHAICGQRGGRDRTGRLRCLRPGRGPLPCVWHHP